MHDGQRAASLVLIEGSAQTTASLCWGISRACCTQVTSRLHAVIWWRLACDYWSPLQGLDARVRRDNLRATWVPTGDAMRTLELEHGMFIRFVIGYRCAACVWRVQPSAMCRRTGIMLAKAQQAHHTISWGLLSQYLHDHMQEDPGCAQHVNSRSRDPALPQSCAVCLADTGLNLLMQ